MSRLNVHIAQLERTNAALVEECTKAEHERDEYRKLYELMREENERLRRGLIGQKAERLPSDVKQLSFKVLEQILGGQLGETKVPDLRPVKPHRRCKPTGRKPLPEHLPSVRIEVLPDEVKQLGLDAFVKIGEEVREHLESRPQSLMRVQTVRPKFLLKERAKDEPIRIHIAEPPELPIEKGLAGPGLLADTIVKRWDDHLPLNRLERIYKREGVELARSTICGWHEQLADLAQPLIAAMIADALTQPYLCTDATGVLVQAKEKCRRGHFWVLVAPERHVLFRFSDRHDSAAVDELLAGYEGYLVADAHTVYDHLFKDGRIKESGCWAHTRRYFYKSLSSDPDRAKVALALIAKLFRIERSIAGSPRKKREEARLQEAEPLVERFFEWCEEQVDSVLDESPIAKGIGYALNQQMALRRFLEDARLPIHNNVSERELRREVVGRKNWLFLGSEDAAQANTTFVSLLASCRMHGIEPWGYLRDLFCLLPRWATV